MPLMKGNMTISVSQNSKQKRYISPKLRNGCHSQGIGKRGHSYKMRQFVAAFYEIFMRQHF